MTTGTADNHHRAEPAHDPAGSAMRTTQKSDMHPSDIIYNLVLETANGVRPLRVSLKFKSHDRYIMAIQDPITQQALHPSLDTQRLDEAIQLFKWAVENDPDPVAPALAKFIKSI